MPSSLSLFFSLYTLTYTHTNLTLAGSLQIIPHLQLPKVVQTHTGPGLVCLASNAFLCLYSPSAFSSAKQSATLDSFQFPLHT